MKRITQLPGHQVPSWSSLSKEGSIQYLDAANELKFKETGWATNDFENPFTTLKGLANEAEIVAFRGLARKLHVSKLDMLVNIRFDDDEDFEVNDLRCVVIGRDKVEGGRVSPKDHVLVIHQSRNSVGDLVWERVGVASLNSSVIENNGVWVSIY